MQLIDRKIDLNTEMNKLLIKNKKPVKEITRQKLAEAELKKKLKQKKAST